MLTLSRTSGRMSLPRAPSGRTISICCQVPLERGAHLPDPRILAAGVGVDLLEQGDLVGLVAAADRIGLAVAPPVGAARGQRQDAAVTGLDRADRLDRATQRRLAQLRAVGAADRLAGDRAQAEALGGVERGALEPAIVEGEALGLPVFQEQLAVVRPRAALRQAAPPDAPARARSPPMAAGARSHGHSWQLPEVRKDDPELARHTGISPRRRRDRLHHMGIAAAGSTPAERAVARTRRHRRNRRVRARGELRQSVT